MLHAKVEAFLDQMVDIEQEGERMSLEPFQRVILSSGTVSLPGPGEGIKRIVSKVEIIGDAREPKDIFTAVQAGYALAQSY